MKILKDITIDRYLDLLDSDNNTFRKYYSEGLSLDSEKYRKLLTEEELILDMMGVNDEVAPNLLVSSDAKDDFENSKRIFEWLMNLSLSDANDQRFWTSLAHINFQEYTRTRWKIDKKTTNETIKQRYFYSGGSLQARLRNSISRLWWISKLTVREDLDDVYFYTKIVWSSQDLMQNLFERSLGTYTAVRFAFLKFYNDRLDVYDSKQLRIFYKEINTLGALSPLSLMTEDEVYDFLLKVEGVYYSYLDISKTINISNESSIEGYQSSESQNVEPAEVLIKPSGPLYYIKKITRQDVLRTFVLNREAVDQFFRLELLKRDDVASIRVRYGPEGPILTTKIVLKQDVRIYISRGGLEMGDIVAFKRIGSSFYEIKFFKKTYKRFKKLNIILENKNYAILDNVNF
jgi:hypothetical protein